MLDEGETACVERCSSKFISCSNRLIKIYAGVQERTMNKRIESTLAEEKLNQGISSDPVQSVWILRKTWTNFMLGLVVI